MLKTLLEIHKDIFEQKRGLVVVLYIARSVFEHELGNASDGYITMHWQGFVIR